MEDGEGELVTHAQVLGVELEGLLDALGELEVVGFAGAVGAQGVVAQGFAQCSAGAFVIGEALT